MDGIVRSLDSMAKKNQVGFLSFEDEVKSRVPVAPLTSNKFEIADVAREMRARGETALFDAVKEGIEMTAAAEGEPDAIRAVIVLTDGQANEGSTGFDDIILMGTRGEETIRRFRGFKDESTAIADSNRRVDKTELIGMSHVSKKGKEMKIQVFFIGIGDDADLEVGRLLAEATGAEFVGVAEDGLANVLEEFSGYF